MILGRFIDLYLGTQIIREHAQVKIFRAVPDLLLGNPARAGFCRICKANQRMDWIE